MATVEADSNNIKSLIARPGITLIDFWASWCGPCRYFAPIFERTSEKHPDVVFAKVDTEEQRMLAAAFGIQSIPTLAAFRDGVMLLCQPGAVSEAALDGLIGQIRTLDMSKIAREIEEEETKAALVES